MSKRKEQALAISLREQGFSYSEILNKFEESGLQVSKGSLSNWLKRVPLTDEQQKRLQEKEEMGKKKGRDKIIEMRVSDES